MGGVCVRVGDMRELKGGRCNVPPFSIFLESKCNSSIKDDLQHAIQG